MARAKVALGLPTTRAVVEESLRRVAEAGEKSGLDRATRQLGYLERLALRVDTGVYRSEEMWR